MCDIIMSVPWHCGESDCPVGWHRANYWTAEDGGYTYDAYGDGDHEELEAKDLPDDKEILDSYRRYHEHCLETGGDPIGEYIVESVRKLRRPWQVRFRNSILGAVFVGARRASRGEWLEARDISKELYGYLCLKRTDTPVSSPHIFGDAETDHPFRELVGLVKEDDDIKVQAWRHELKFTVVVEETQEVPEITYKRKVREIARRALKRDKAE